MRGTTNLDRKQIKSIHNLFFRLILNIQIVRPFHLEPQNLSYMWNYLFFTKIYANPLNCASIYVHISQQQSSVIPRITIN